MFWGGFKGDVGYIDLVLHHAKTGDILPGL